MRYAEAALLKKGDLVTLDNRNKNYGGLILEVESVDSDDNTWCCRVTLKQPGFNGTFRIKDYDSRHLQRYKAE